VKVKEEASHMQRTHWITYQEMFQGKQLSAELNQKLTVTLKIAYLLIMCNIM